MNALATILNAPPVPPDALIIILALLLDLTLGEPPNRLHPTAWMGKTVALAERIAPGPHRTPAAQFAYGAAMALLIPTLWGALAWAIAAALWTLHPLAYIAAGAILLKTTFAVRMLHRTAAAVAQLLTAGDIDAARRQMSSLVSRDPAQLTAGQMAAAAIESVAENITDSIVGPLLAFAIFGLPGAIAYRAVNTLDSMVGYHGRYEYLGKPSARLDDVVNLIPARLAALLLILTTLLLPRLSPRRAVRILRAHRRRTASPNAGWTMAAMAGALRVTLAKPDHYRLGDPAPEPAAHHIQQATQALYITTALTAATAIALAWLRLTTAPW